MKKKHIKILIIFMVCICLILGIFILINYFFSDNIISKRNVKYLSEANGYIYMHNKKNVKVVDNEKINISKKVKENHIYDLFKFENAQIYSKNGLSYFEFDVTNLSYVPKNDLPYYIMIKFYDKNKNIIYVENYQVPNLAQSEKKHEKIEYPFDITNAYDYEFYLF